MALPGFEAIDGSCYDTCVEFADMAVCSVQASLLAAALSVLRSEKSVNDAAKKL